MATDIHQQQAKQEEQGTERIHTGQVYRPPVDIVESQGELSILVDLPGAKSDSIDIDFKEGLLTIEARVPAREPHEGRPLVREYGVGDYRRAFHVGEEIDSARIHAEYSEGVLTVHLPRSEATKPRKIQVRAGASR
jgi:HSP20 family protein